MSTTLPTSIATRRKRKHSRLMEAVTAGNVDKIIKLLANCEPNFVDDNTGETPLSLAASLPTASNAITQRVIVALVNGGALLDYRTKDGKTALHCAVLKSNYVALKTLLDLGASPNYRDANGLTPLFYTILYKVNSKLTQLLLHEYSIHGISDQQGWQEVHHACKLGLVTHLEQLLYYGCDMNCKIEGSGNTPLHVAAINDQMDCARVLLLRGCNTQITNNSHQNAYQVAVIANNMELSELIANHKPENIVPYRDKPKYNPARRPPSNYHNDASKQKQQALKEEYTKKFLNGTSSKYNPSVSPCPSQKSCTTSTTSSSDACCEVDSSHSEEIIDDNENSIITEKVYRVEGRREQKLLGIGSSTTLPARGRREMSMINQSRVILSEQDPNSGQPPITSYDEKTVSLHKGSKGFGFVLRGEHATSPYLKQAQENISAPQPISLQYLDDIEPYGVAEAAGLRKGDFLINVNGVDIRSAPHEHVVSLIRQSGDKVTMTVATPIYQVLDSKDAEVKVNGDSKDTKRFSTIPRGPLNSETKSKAPPAPPKRDPSTTLSIGRARAKSLFITSDSSDTINSNANHSSEAQEKIAKINNDNYDSEGRSTKSSSPTTSIESIVCNSHKVQLRNKDSGKTASVRAEGSNRVSAIELEQFLTRRNGVDNNHGKCSISALKKKKKKMEKDFHSTPNIQQELLNEERKLGNMKTSDNHSRLATSQEDIKNIETQKKITEILTLKKRETTDDTKTSLQSKHSLQSNSHSAGLSVVVKVDVGNKRSKSDYTNLSQIQNKELEEKVAKMPLVPSVSSFKPIPLSAEKNSAQTKYLSDKVQDFNIQQHSFIATHVKTNSVNEDISKNRPFIPDPDYSSSEDDNTQTNAGGQNVSTFKSAPIGSKGSSRMVQSYHEVSNSEATKGDDIMTASLDTKSIAPSERDPIRKVQSCSEELAQKVRKGSEGSIKSLESMKEDVINNLDDTKPLSEPLNKVKESIKVFERRSSLSFDNSNNVQQGIVDNKCKKNNNTSNVEPLAALDSVPTHNTSYDSNALKVSKSCFEVDHNSPEASSLIDNQANLTEKSSNFHKKVQQGNTLGHRNTIVAEKISNIITATSTSPTCHSLSEYGTKAFSQVQATQNCHSIPMDDFISQCESISIASAPVPNTSRAAPTTAKTWSEISSAIRAVKGSPTPNIIHSKNSISTRPTSAPISSKSKEINTKMHVDSLTLSGVNEVDALSEVVPPPPEFAAPPPNISSRDSRDPSKVSTRNQVANKHQAVKSQTPGIQVKKEEMLISAPQQTHIVHKPTAQSVHQPVHHLPHQINQSHSSHSYSSNIQHNQSSGQQTFSTGNSWIINENLQLVRKSATPPPPPPEFCDNSAAARLGVNLAHHKQPYLLNSKHHPQLYQQNMQADQCLQQQLHQQQQFATLTRYTGKHGHGISKQLINNGQYLLSKSIGSESPILCSEQNLCSNVGAHNYQQFATLTRTRPGQHSQVGTISYSDYTKLRLMRQAQAQAQAQSSQNQMYSHQTHHIGHQHSYMGHSGSMHLNQSSQPPQPVHPPPPGPPPSLSKTPITFPRKSMVDWTEEDVCDWVVSIGMIEHRTKFEYINGMKLLRLDNNDLIQIGVRPSQHRVFILEKIKQHLHYQQHHPPSQ